jgi:hypothetical protein
MLPEALQPYGLLYYPRIGLSNFLHQFRAATPISRKSWSCKPVILDVSNFRQWRSKVTGNDYHIAE